MWSYRFRLSRSAVAAVLLFAWSHAAHAQTAYGPGGLFVQPTAIVPPARTLDLNVSTFTQRIGGRPSAQSIPHRWLTRSPTEFRRDRYFCTDRSMAASFCPAACSQSMPLTPDKQDRPAFALTGSFLTGDVRLASIGLVASHACRSGDRTVLSLHAGGLWGRRDDIRNPGNSLSAFVGADVPLSREFSLVAEYGTRFSFDYKERSSYEVVWRPRRGPRSA